MASSIRDTSYQSRWTKVSMQQLANYCLQCEMLNSEAKATITNCLPNILSAGERIRAAGWVILSVITDCLTLRLRGIVTGKGRSGKAFLRCETISVEKTREKLKRRMKLEKLICESSFEHIERLRGVAWAEIRRVKELDAKTRIGIAVFLDIRYVNRVLKGILKRLEMRYRTAYDSSFAIDKGVFSRPSYDAITLTKDVGKFAEELRDGKVSEEDPAITCNYDRRGWNELSRVVHTHLGERASSLTEDGKKEIMDAVMMMKGWQGVNELSSWAVLHIALSQIMAYGKVNCIYRAIYGFKGDPRRRWHFGGWLIRYIAVYRTDDWTFKVPGEQYSVKLRQPNIEGGVWYAARTTCQHGGIAIREEDYDGVVVQIDPEVIHTIRY